ncbi:MAG: alpha/beta hydrolase family protein, partial [Opitutaceae bacterium]
IWDGVYYTGVSAVDRDGKNWKDYTGFNDADPNPLLATRIIHAFGDSGQNVLMLNRGSDEGKDRLYQDVIKVSTLTGAHQTVVQNPGNVVGWVVDRQGVVRLGVTAEGLRFGAIHRQSEQDPWRQLPLFDEKLGNIRPLGFDRDAQQLVVATTSDRKRRAVHFYDLAEGRLGELIAGHDHYDIVPEIGAPRVDGVSLAAPISSELAGTVVGVRYVTEGPRVRWFDPGLTALQAAVDRALPQTLNLITSRSRDEKRFLILAFSDRDPGAYYLLDLQSGKPVFGQLGARVQDFPVERMAPMFPIQYPARDGEVIHGYLTQPLGEKKTGLPLVVLPHGGPNVRDVWGYNPLVQFLASRGYAVLQMNYRGSPGYGTEFFEKGKREVGRGIQTDIEDGARWTIAEGLADPGRIAIVGGSYGGYSALYALGHSPGLYRCGISIAGVTDWAEITKKRRGEEYKFAFLHFKQWIGDLETDAEFLAAISPVNFAGRIKAPVLIVQGKEDRTVPPNQARRMATALEQAGHKPQTIYFSGEGHSFKQEKNRARLFREIEAFLAKNLAPGG